MPKGRRNFFMVLLVLFSIASVALITKGLGNRYSVAKAEGMCPYIRITEEELTLLQNLRELPEVAESFEQNAEVAEFIPMDLEQGAKTAADYLPQGAEVVDFSTYSRTVLLGYTYDGYRINVTLNSQEEAEKVAAVIPPDGEAIKLAFINENNKSVTRHEMDD